MSELHRVDGKQVYWQQGDIVHACDGADFGAYRDVKLLWTLCQKDVPANAAHTLKHSEHLPISVNGVTCDKCKELLK